MSDDCKWWERFVAWDTAFQILFVVVMFSWALVSWLVHQ